MSDHVPVLIAGSWRPASATRTYRAVDPTRGECRDDIWPVSGWSDVEEALDAAVAAAQELARLPVEAVARFLERYADRLETRGDELVALAHAETGLARAPRLAEVEMPRTLLQLRQAAASAREQTWRMAMIDTRTNIRAAAFGLGPVVVFPPSNFPLAYGAVTGGDFASAIAAGNPVIAKAHELSPSVSRVAAEEAVAALSETGLPNATVQLIHGLDPHDGERLVADPRVGATGFTGSQVAGEALFRAASAAGRVIWVEMGSINPVVFLPGAVAERGDALADDLTASVTGSAGQFCTKPGLVVLVRDPAGEALTAAIARRFASMGPQVLLGRSACDRLVAAVSAIEQAGASVIAGAASASSPTRHAPTLLSVSGRILLERPDDFLVEAFGNATLVVTCDSLAEVERVVAGVHGSLGASIYTATDGRDDEAFGAIAPLLMARAGRVVENRMPTGLGIVPSMQHGGPWPSAGPPFFSSVGFPWTMLRFARRICFDGWSDHRLPAILRDAPPPGRPWRYVDQSWTRGGLDSCAS